MNSISGWFYKISNGWVALAFLAVFILFSVLTLPGQSSLSEDYSQGAGSPDTSLFYSGSEIYQMAGEYGEEGRTAYLTARWTFDLAFPLIYTGFLITSISWMFCKILKSESRWRLLNLVPVLAMVSDLLENSMSSLVFGMYPVHSFGEILAPIFTPVKWLLVVSSFFLLILGVIMLAAKKVNKI